MVQKIYWVELQGELSAAGLSVSLGLPNQLCAPTWGGELDGQRYLLFTDAYRNHRDLNLQAVS